MKKGWMKTDEWMKDEWGMMKDEGWMMKDEGFKLLRHTYPEMICPSSEKENFSSPSLNSFPGD